ncbi:MAG: polyprenyl synthetase family protein [Clostridia bacterium]
MDLTNSVDANSVLLSFLPKGDDRLYKAMEYSLLSGGKRKRFFTCLAVADYFLLDNNQVRAIASAIEMIHTYSLIHDDLPCMDDDDFRRGKPSCHKEFDVATALLAGDGLLNTAISILLQNNDLSFGYAEAINSIFECSGVNGMILGQSFDLQSACPNYQISLLKTSKMFVASVLSIAKYACASQQIQQYFIDYANFYGLAFQLADDLADNEVKNGEDAQLLEKYLTNAYFALKNLNIYSGYLFDNLNQLKIK